MEKNEGKAKITQEKTQNSRKKLKTQGKNSMSRRTCPLPPFQVTLKKPDLEHYGCAHRCLTYIIVLQVLEQGDLSDGSAGGPLLVLKPNLLQSNQVVSQTTLTLEHRSVSPLKLLGTKSCHILKKTGNCEGF